MPSTTLDGYENPDPTPNPPFFADLKVPLRPISPISQRILSHIDSIEDKGVTARHSSFVVIPSSGIWRKIGNKTFYRLFGLRYIRHDRKENGLQHAINDAKSRVFIKDANYGIATALTLKSGIALEGESMPQVTSVDPTPPENITFTNNANGDTGTVLTTTGANDCFTGTLLRTVSVTNMGLGGFTNGFNLGTSNVLGISNSTIARVLFSSVATPLNLTNFQMLRLDQLYAWLPTTNLILAQNNNTNWNGGNSLWTDIFGHGCKNVNGAVSLVAVAGFLNMIECHRLQVNMQDAAFTNSTSGYGLYLQGQSNSAQCQSNDFYSLDLEGEPLKAVRLEDYAFANTIHIGFDNLASGGFDFSLKKNSTATPPTWNLLKIAKAGTVKAESDTFQNFLISSGNVAPLTGSYPAGISGIAGANFNGAQFTTLLGGGPGHDFVGAANNNLLATQTNTTANIASWALPSGAGTQNMEVGAELKVTAYTSGTIQVQVSYTDRDGNAQTLILPLVADNGTVSSGATATGNFRSPTMALCTNTATITIATIGSFTATYKASGFIRATA